MREDAAVTAGTDPPDVDPPDVDPPPGLDPPPERAEYEDPEVTALRQAWQRGEPLSAPGLTAVAGGGLLLGPAPTWKPPGRKTASRVAGVSLAVLLLALRVLPAGWVNALAGIAAAAGLMVAGLTVLAAIRRRAGVARLSVAGISVPTWYGRERTVAKDQIRRLVLVAVDLRPLPLRVPRLLIIGDDGRCLVPVSGAGVAIPALRAFAAAVGVPVEGRPGPVGAVRLRREYPGSVPWSWAHQAETGLAIWLVFLAALAVAVFGLSPV
jgi:hypothetical protein